ncbi:MAG: hypothetical protein J6A52_07065 [Bacilli bacterium]|nr:hypothetical protein [Bacilli bacterium]
MEKKVNKKEFAKSIKEQTNYNDEKCMMIVNIIEDNFLLLTNNKDKIISELIEKLSVSFEEANNIYNISITIIKSEIKRKILHPFRNQN